MLHFIRFLAFQNTKPLFKKILRYVSNPGVRYDVFKHYNAWYRLHPGISIKWLPPYKHDSTTTNASYTLLNSYTPTHIFEINKMENNWSGFTSSQQCINYTVIKSTVISYYIINDYVAMHRDGSA